MLKAMRGVSWGVGAALAVVAVSGQASRAWAQADAKVTVPGAGEAPNWVAAQIQDPDDPRVRDYAKRQKRRVDMERELFKIRAEYIRNIRNTEIRQIGIHKIRGYTDPVVYPSLLKIFEREGMDVRSAILDHLVDQKNDEADTVVTWGAIFDRSEEFRKAAAERLNRRIAENQNLATPRIKSVVAEGLRTGNKHEKGAAASLADALNLVEAIPMLISAQIQGSTVQTGSGDEGGSLAWILVGTQQAFVSDLQPVVGDSAVAFDPTISVVTEGTVLRVIDASVVTYHYEIHNALVRMSSRAWGQSTERLGWDNPAWRKWYADEFKPYWAAKQAEEAEKQAGDGPGDG